MNIDDLIEILMTEGSKPFFKIPMSTKRLKTTQPKIIYASSLPKNVKKKKKRRSPLMKKPRLRDTIINKIDAFVRNAFL